MVELSMLAQSLAFGAGLGIFYFGGLWITLRHLPDSKQPALYTLGSFIGRSLICLLGFYLVLGSGLDGLISSIAGFILIKIILINRLVCGGAN